MIGKRLIAPMAVAGALGVLGLGIATGSPAAHTQATASSNEAQAQADASARLSSLNLPAGAQPLATEPAGGGSALANPASGVSSHNVVHDHGWWVIPGSPRSVISYIDAHPPAGSTPNLSGSGGSPQQVTITGFSWPAITDVLSYRQLVVDSVRLPGGDTGLRADVEVVWIVPRASTERIPAGVRRLTVSAHQFDMVVLALFTVRAPRRLRKAIAVLDSLPLFQPGVYNCPADFGLEIRMAFYGRHGSPLAVSVVDPDGCGGVGLKVRGRHEPELTGTAVPGSGLPANFSLIGALDKALGVKLPTSPQ